MAEEKDEAMADDDYLASDDDSAEDTEVVVSDEAFNLATKNKARDELARQIEEFLAHGGKINLIESNVTADPPRKPTNSYGSHPI